MRALNEKEVKLIAGGTGNGSSITVVGHRSTSSWFPPPFTTVSYTGGGGGGGGTTSPPGVDPNHNYDSERDTLAQQIKSDINHLSDHNTKEHGALIYVGSDGQLHSSPIFNGTEKGIDPQVMRDWMAANGVSMDQLVGFVHNHDVWYYGGSELAENVNRYPSVNDWGFADSFVHDGAGAGTSGFALYVIDTAGQLRQFDYADASIYRGMDNDHKDGGTNLPPTM